jgi:hypothetical protein
MERPVKIIVARYNENLEWMRESPFNLFRYIVYNKGINDDFEKCNVDEVINLPNIGRCDHTYLYHIVNNFNKLNVINVFFPGCLNMENKKNIAKEILYNIIKHKTAILYCNKVGDIKKEFKNFTINNWGSVDEANRKLQKDTTLYPAKLRPYGKWFNYMFGEIKVSYFSLYGILSIHKLDILKHNISRYIELLNSVSVHSNPEVGHYIERSWVAIFHPILFTKIIDKSPANNLNMVML